MRRGEEGCFVRFVDMVLCACFVVWVEERGRRVLKGMGWIKGVDEGVEVGTIFWGL